MPKHALINAPESIGAVYPILAVQNHQVKVQMNCWDPQRLINGNYIDALSLEKI